MKLGRDSDSRFGGTRRSWSPAMARSPVLASDSQWDRCADASLRLAWEGADGGGLLVHARRFEGLVPARESPPAHELAVPHRP
jgi:hypothetical protein